MKNNSLDSVVSHILKEALSPENVMRDELKKFNAVHDEEPSYVWQIKGFKSHAAFQIWHDSLPFSIEFHEIFANNIPFAIEYRKVREVYKESGNSR